MRLPHGQLHRVDRRRWRKLEMRRHGLAESAIWKAIVLLSPRVRRRSRRRPFFRLLQRRCLPCSRLVLVLQTLVQAPSHQIIIRPCLLHMCILPLLRPRPRPTATLQFLALQDFSYPIICLIHAPIISLVVLHRFGLHRYKMFIWSRKQLVPLLLQESSVIGFMLLQSCIWY